MKQFDFKKLFLNYESFAEKLQSINLLSSFPKISERDFWETVDEEYRNYFICDAEKCLKEIKNNGWPHLYASEFMEFSENGNRINFENSYFRRRNMLTVLVIAECMENVGKFLKSIIDGIFLLCQESGWQLPAHNSYERDAFQSPLPDLFNPVLDLFACETSAQLSLIYFLLEDVLVTKSSFITERIEKELEQRIIVPYTEKHFWWMGNNNEPMCNWTPWCTQNILITAFTFPHPLELQKKIILQALYSLDCFLKDYGDDGCCSEGPEYYRHAGLCLCNCIKILQEVCADNFTEICCNEKIRNIAEYIVNVHIRNSKYYYNFADASPVAGMGGVREFVFAELVNSQPLREYSVEQWNSSSTGEKFFNCSFSSTNGSNIFYVLQALTISERILPGKHNETNEENKRENNIAGTLQRNYIFYESLGLYAKTLGNYSVAVKAGNNGDSHNHNDVGSFTVYKNCRPFVIDIGVESYTKKTFSSDRYQIWTMQSSWHNLPEFDGAMQKYGSEYAARNIKADESGISMDIARAYADETRVENYFRRVSFENNRINVCDTCKKNNVCMNLIFSCKPSIESSGDKTFIKLSDDAETENFASVVFESAIRDASVEEVKVTDKRLMRAWKNKIYRVRFYFDKDLSFSLS